MKKYDIFISYRRDTGAETAKHLRDMLTAKGCRVFFDTDSLRSGDFNTELLRVIDECKDFILILMPGSLDRCVNEDDWVRQELAQALASGKNVIPILGAGFSFPEELPEEIDAVRYKNGISANVEYFDAVVDKLVGFLKTNPRRMFITRRVLPAVLAVIVAGLAVFGLWRGISGIFASKGAFPKTESERSLVTEAANYMMFNSGVLNGAYLYYDEVLENAAGLLTGDVSAASLETLSEKIAFYSDKLNGSLASVEDVPTALADRTAQCPQLEGGDLAASAGLARQTIRDMIDNMNEVSARLADPAKTAQDNTAYVDTLRSEAALEKEYWIVCLNQLFAKVSPDALREMLTSSLPSYTHLYDTAYDWTQDADALAAREQSLYAQMQDNLLWFAAQVPAAGQTADASQEVSPFAEQLGLTLRALGEKNGAAAANAAALLPEKAGNEAEQLLAEAAVLWVSYDGALRTNGCCFVLQSGDSAVLAGDFILVVDGEAVNETETLAALLPGGGDHDVTLARPDGNGKLIEQTVRTGVSAETLLCFGFAY